MTAKEKLDKAIATYVDAKLLDLAKREQETSERAKRDYTEACAAREQMYEARRELADIKAQLAAAEKTIMELETELATFKPTAEPEADSAAAILGIPEPAVTPSLGDIIDSILENK